MRRNVGIILRLWGPRAQDLGLQLSGPWAAGFWTWAYRTWGSLKQKMRLEQKAAVVVVGLGVGVGEGVAVAVAVAVAVGAGAGRRVSLGFEKVCVSYIKSSIDAKSVQSYLGVGDAIKTR